MIFAAFHNILLSASSAGTLHFQPDILSLCPSQTLLRDILVDFPLIYDHVVPVSFGDAVELPD